MICVISINNFHVFFCKSFSAYFNDIVVGAVCCRIDTSDNQRRLYIMTLGCLAPYRRLHIGRSLNGEYWCNIEYSVHQKK